MTENKQQESTPSFDLGQIDLSVQDNKSGLLRTELYVPRQDEDDKTYQNEMKTGRVRYDQASLRDMANAGVVLDLFVLGMLIFDKDVTPQLALETIRSIRVLGLFRASKTVKAALMDAQDS